ncbi:MAG: hypothetical protein ACLRPV_08030 [Lacrimispora saccharolytica]
MISYEKAKMGKRLMKQFIVEGELEKAAFIGLMYQMPIRIGDAIKLRKSDLSGRNVLKISAKYGKLYTNRHGNPYRITRQLQSILNSINGDSDMIFTRRQEYYIRFFHRYRENFHLHDFRRERLMNEELLESQKRRKQSKPAQRFTVEVKDGKRIFKRGSST